MSRNRGQSTLEYVVILIAIIGTVLIAVKYFAATNNTQGVGLLMQDAINKVTTKTGTLPGITPPTTGGTTSPTGG